MVELPEDDDGYGLFRTVTPHTPTAPAASTARKATPGPTKGKPKKRAASSTGSAAHKQAHGSSMALDLPDDDDAGFQISQPCSVSKPSTSSARVPRVPGGQSDDLVLDCEDATLKIAASNIDSVIHHPHQDLMKLMESPDPEPSARCHAWEFFSIPRITPKIRELGGRARRSYDLRHFWDLGEAEFIRVAIQDLLLLRPLFIILSPPCTLLSQLQHSNWKRMKVVQRWVRLLEGLLLIDSGMWMAAIQILLGHFFIFEHPAYSLAWERESVAWLWDDTIYNILHHGFIQFRDW